MKSTKFHRFVVMIDDNIRNNGYDGLALGY